jgi:succinate dehydrogenase/fumarate reductase flavoprotein subunit
MEQELRADLLVIGGGFGGLFAAIQARKRGVRDVLIVDKGAVGLTGQSRMAAGATIFVHPGDDVEQWADAIFRGQNGLCNQDMVESFLAGSTERLREIESLGVVYRAGGGEKYLRMPSRGLAPAMMTLFPQYRGMTGGSALTTALREQALALGVRFCDKVFISDLIVQDGRAAGAVGCQRRTGEFCVFHSQAVVVAACDCSFRGNYACVEATTGDAFGMAHRAGVDLCNMEFLCSNTGPVRFNFEGTGPAGQLGARFRNAGEEAFMSRYRQEGDRAELNFIVQAMAREVRSGSGPPFYFDFRGLPEGLEQGYMAMGGWMPRNLARLREAGITPFGTRADWTINIQTLRGGIKTDLQCMSNLGGLFAAGTAHSMGPGLFNGWSSGRSIWSGSAAGHSAAAWIRGGNAARPNRDRLGELRERLFGHPIDAERGDLSLHDVTLRLQRCLFAYETSVMKSQASLERARREVRAIAEEAMPRVRISDHHEFIRFQETQNMLLTAELFLTASLLRTETRSDHFREDYPEPDPAWLQWIVFNRGLEAGHRIEPLPWPDYRRQPEHLQKLSEGPA